MLSDLKAKADHLVALIRKHHGYLGADQESIYFRSFADAEAFRQELDAESIPEDVFNAATTQLDQE